MLQEPGADLDREVARKLGEEGREASPFSTDPRAADGLIARLEQSGIFAACERVGSTWYCTLSTDVGGIRERLATGAGSSRPAALCRAVVNLPGETLNPRPGKPAAK
jgi:hypothetical protein